MYINRLKAENWKNFRKVDVELNYRLFLIGPNASGKSNFLDVFRFLRDLCVSGGGLQQAVDVRRGGVSAIRCLAARSKPDITIEVGIKDEKSDTDWSYRLTFSQDNNRTPIIRREEVRRNGEILLDRPTPADKKDSLRLTETALEQTVANEKFRAMVTFFQTVSYRHLIPQAMREPQDFSSGKIENDAYGRDFLRLVQNTQATVRDSRLRKISAAMGVAIPQLEKLETQLDELTGQPHLVAHYKHWRPHAGKQDERQFSDGTLRLFGLLWTLFEGEGPLLLEEPELSLHSEIVRYLPQIIEKVQRSRGKGKRQILLSTHSSELLSDKSIGGEEVLRLAPDKEGTVIESPLDNAEEKALLEQGLTPADVVLPKSAPARLGQMLLGF